MVAIVVMVMGLGKVDNEQRRENRWWWLGTRQRRGDEIEMDTWNSNARVQGKKNCKIRVVCWNHREIMETRQRRYIHRD